jgi:hypothetical protein
MCTRENETRTELTSMRAERMSFEVNMMYLERNRGRRSAQPVEREAES